MASPQDEQLKIYEQLCNSYRAIDDFRAKLLGFLPLATGTGVFLLLTDRAKIVSMQQFFQPIGAFGFVITLGLFFYELYGIKKCTSLISAGRKLEGDLEIENGQFKQRPPGVALLINEPLASGVIYPAVLAAWTFLALAFPQLQDPPQSEPLEAAPIHLRGLAYDWAIRVFLAGFALSFLYNLFLVRDDIGTALARLKTRIATKFLTAEWRHLAMLNFEVDPKVLQPLVPAGTELDDWQGRTFISVVGFMFLNTRVFGVAIPFHRNFEEVNLRFYVRRKASDGWRRGVVFVKEIVPRAAIALTARVVYGENYVAVPMTHHIEAENDGAATPRKVSYSWRFRGRENRIELTVEGDAHEATEGSDAEFITEHYWGYARRRGGRTMEYRVEHPRWRIARASAGRLDCDVAGLYGSQFVEFLNAPAASAFLADGSDVTVFRGTLLPS